MAIELADDTIPVVRAIKVRESYQKYPDGGRHARANNERSRRSLIPDASRENRLRLLEEQSGEERNAHRFPRRERSQPRSCWPSCTRAATPAPSSSPNAAR